MKVNLVILFRGNLTLLVNDAQAMLPTYNFLTCHVLSSLCTFEQAPPIA